MKPKTSDSSSLKRTGHNFIEIITDNTEFEQMCIVDEDDNIAPQ